MSTPYVTVDETGVGHDHDNGCSKLGVSFYHFLGDRLGIAGKTVPPLATLVLARA